MTVSIRDSFKGLYRLCECGCGILISITNNLGRFSRFKQGHQNIGRMGKNTGGRIKIGDYWYVRIDGKYKVEHVYFYEQYHKCCMLKWGVVHHIDPVRENYCNNMPWNLEGMMRSKHQSYHSKDRKGKKRGYYKGIVPSNIICIKCGGNDTYVTKDGMMMWYGNKTYGSECSYCYDEERRRKKKELLI